MGFLLVYYILFFKLGKFNSGSDCGVFSEILGSVNVIFCVNGFKVFNCYDVLGDFCGVCEFFVD